MTIEPWKIWNLSEQLPRAAAGCLPLVGHSQNIGGTRLSIFHRFITTLCG
jgi:hypothetical protein